MSATDKFRAAMPQSTAAQAGLGVVVLGLMASGGTYLGLRIEPEECADARTQVAVCEEREASAEATLAEARADVDRLRAERDECLSRAALEPVSEGG